MALHPYVRNCSTKDNIHELEILYDVAYLAQEEGSC